MANGVSTLFDGRMERSDFASSAGTTTIPVKDRTGALRVATQSASLRLPMMPNGKPAPASQVFGLRLKDDAKTPHRYPVPLAAAWRKLSGHSCRAARRSDRQLSLIGMS